MNKLKEYILEKLVITKDTKEKNPISTEDVLILDGIVGSYGSSAYAYDLSLLITSLEHMQADYNAKDIIIITQGYHDIETYYIFHKNSSKLIWIWSANNKKNKISDLLIYPVENKFANYGMLNKFIKNLNKQVKQNKYINFNFADAGNKHFRYLYVWYSKSKENICMYFSDLDYKTLQEQNKFI